MLKKKEQKIREQKKRTKNKSKGFLLSFLFKNNKDKLSKNNEKGIRIKNNEESAQNMFCIDFNPSHNNIVNEIVEKHTSHVNDTSTSILSLPSFRPVSQISQISQILQLLVNINSALANVSANPEQI